MGPGTKLERLKPKNLETLTPNYSDQLPISHTPV